MENDIGPTLAAKSDQLNAADLMGGPVTVKIIGVTVNKSDQPVIISIDGGHQPYKPCLGMRRVLANVYGDSSAKWVGQSLTLYCDPEVSWGGKAVGGIRISHVTGIETSWVDVLIRKSRAVVETVRIFLLSVSLPAYLDEDIDKHLDGWVALFKEDKTTPEKLIYSMCKKYTMTSEQKQTIRGAYDAGNS